MSTSSEKPDWYAAYLIFFLDAEEAVGNGDMPVQEDLVLLQASHSEQAYSKALEFGATVADVGQAFVIGRPSAFLARGISRLVPVLFQPAFQEEPAVGFPSELTPNEPRLERRYGAFEFRGLRDLVRIRGQLVHGREIDEYMYVAAESVLDPELTPKRRLLAFNVAGAAITASAKPRYEAAEYARYKWYLADQVFSLKYRSNVQKGVMSIMRKLVLIEAHGPEEAFRNAMIHGIGTERDLASRSDADVELRGLHELSLILDDLRDCCEIRSLRLSVPKARWAGEVRSKRDLKAFRKPSFSAGSQTAATDNEAAGERER